MSQWSESKRPEANQEKMQPEKENRAMMTEITIPVAEHLYDETARITRITGYGIQYEEFIRGQVSLPPEGARFDIAFEGAIRGEKLNGEISAVDYAEVRADGRFQLDMRGKITTDDGEKIAYVADGTFAPPEDDTGIAQARYSVRLATASPKYRWVNKLQIWVRGSVDVNKGEIRVKAYAA